MKIKDIIEQAIIGNKVRCRAIFEGGDWYISLYEGYVIFEIQSMNYIQGIYDYHIELETDLGNLVIYNFDEFEVL